MGRTHARIGLEPQWYIGGYAVLLERLVHALVLQAWPKGMLAKAQGGEAAAEALGALIKVALLDIDLAISVYLEAAEAARLEAEGRVLAAERARVVESVGAGLAGLAAGDLTMRLAEGLPDEYRQLRDDFNLALGALEEALARVAARAGGIGAGVDEIAQSADSLSGRTEEQATSLEETAAALDQITAAVARAAAGARRASDVVASARDAAGRSSGVVGEAVAAMGRIEESSGRIDQIIGVIDEIAFQTNLLALNAGVEAARAGDAGRGFAVVASEVRILAQRSTAAAAEIKALILESSSHVGEGVRMVGRAGEALDDIVGKVVEIDGLVSAIAASAEEQAAGLGEVNAAVIRMDQVVQQNAAMVEESAAASQALRGETADLGRLVAGFKIASSADGF